MQRSQRVGGVAVPVLGGAQPPHGGIAIAVLVAVFQRELRLADPAHAVDRRCRHCRCGGRSTERPRDLSELVVRVTEVPAQRMLDDVERLLRAGRHAKARRWHPGHRGDQPTEANELRLPVGVAAVEGVHVHCEKTRYVLVQRRVQVVNRWGGCASEQYGNHRRTARAGLATQCLRHLATHVVRLRQAGAAVDLGNPVGTDHYKNHLRSRDGVRQTLREGLPGRDGGGVVEEGAGVEPMSKAVMEPPGMAAPVGASVADEDLRAHVPPEAARVGVGTRAQGAPAARVTQSRVRRV